MDCKSVMWKLFEMTGSPANYMLYKALVEDESKDFKDGNQT